MAAARLARLRAAEADVPFFGTYGALNSHGFFADVLARWTFLDQNITAAAGGPEQSESGRPRVQPCRAPSAGYHHSMGSWFWSPPLLLVAGRLQVDLGDRARNPGPPAAVPGTMFVQDIDTLLGPLPVFGLGTTYQERRHRRCKPFVAANVWHEFRRRRAPEI